MNKVFNNLEKKSKRNSLEKLISRAKFKVDEKNSLLYDNEKRINIQNIVLLMKLQMLHIVKIL